MTQDAFNAAAKAQNDAWTASGKNTLVGVCGTVAGRIMQECRFPDGYASAQNAAVNEPPPSCDILWAQRQKQPAMGIGRIRTTQLDRSPWLGQEAAPTGGVKALTDAQFSEVLAAPKAVAMFYSPNCPYSQKFMPIYQAIAPQHPDVLFASVNVDQDVQNAGTYKVRMLPTVVFFQNGKEVNRIDGVQEQGDFLAEMGRAFSGQVQTAAPPTPAAAATAPPRSGTLVETPAATASPSPVPILLGGAVAAGLLGALGYLVFGK